MNQAAFLDRDGVINQKAAEGEYIVRWDDVHFLPGVSHGIKLLNESGFRVIVVTNQRCVARGLITSHELEVLHRQMREYIDREGARIDDILYCPHEIEPPCNCRKPMPGMLLEAARTHSIEMNKSWMIGDSEVDMRAGKAAGCKTAWVGPRNGSTFGSDVVAESLVDAAEQILRRV